MLNAVLGSLIGILGIAATADWLSWHKRTAGALKQRAELAQAMPTGNGRRALEEHLDEAVVQFITDLEKRRRRRDPVLALALVAGGLLLWAGALVTRALVDGSPWWLTAMIWLGIVIEVVGVALIRGLDRRLNVRGNEEMDPVIS